MDNSQHIQQLKQRTKALNERIDATLNREKLIELLSAALCYQSVEEVADYLIANGVSFAPDPAEEMLRHEYEMTQEFFGEPKEE